MVNHSILIGIVTMNRKDKLERTLRECVRRGFQELVVVDNGSTDGTRELLQCHPEVHMIIPDKNEGGAGGFNRIMRYFASNTTQRWLMLFDDDAWPDFESTDLTKFLSRQDVNRAAYAFRVVYPDGSLCSMNRPGLNVFSKGPFSALLHDHHIDETTDSCPVDFASFVGLLIARDTIAQLGCVSKEFFIYSDDTYYTLSISTKIGKIQYCPEFTFIHDCRRSSRNFSNHTPERLERDVANKIVLIREYGRYWGIWAFMYITRQAVNNPRRIVEVLRASAIGILANRDRYRNESLMETS